jgi:PadR family transcriptional regulator PadR
LRVPVDALKGHLDLVLLAALAEGPAYGYALIDEIRGRSEGAFDLAEGTVYPALYRLESGGLLASEWTVAAGRRRRMYRLTKQGRTELAKERGQWKQFSDTMKTVVA